MWGATPGPLPRRRDGGRWVTRHGAGFTRYAHRAHDITCVSTVFVHAQEPLKFSRLTLTNHSQQRRHLSVFAYNEWALCPPRAGDQRFVVTEQDAETGVLLARNPYNPDFAGRVGIRARQPAVGVRDRRPARVPGPQRLAAPAGGAGAPVAGHALRRRHRPVRGAAAARGPRRRGDARARGAAGTGRRPRARAGAGRPLRQRRGGTRGRGADRAALGRDARHRAGEDARRFLRPAHEPLAALPVAQLAAVGPHRILPARRRLRLPRPAAGRDGARARAPRSLPRAPAALRRPAVRRGRRPALVARAHRPRRAHPVLRRPAVAALRRDPLSGGAPATRPCSTSASGSCARRCSRPASSSDTGGRTPRKRPRRSTNTASVRSSAH